MSEIKVGDYVVYDRNLVDDKEEWHRSGEINLDRVHKVSYVGKLSNGRPYVSLEGNSHDYPVDSGIIKIEYTENIKE